MKPTGIFTTLAGIVVGLSSHHLISHREIKGFTLIELLIVIAIIGILAVMVVPAFHTAREKARSTSCLANLRAISTALTMYSDDANGAMPPELSVLVDDVYLPRPGKALVEPKSLGPYSYHLPPMAWQSMANSVSVEDPSDLHLGGRNQLMNDGRVHKRNQ